MYQVHDNTGNGVFYQVLKLIEDYGLEIGPRGLKTKEISNVNIKLTHPLRSMITFRGASLSYYISELLWYENGNTNVSFIENFSKFWSKLKDDKGEVVSNYGFWIWCMTQRNGFSQFENVVKMLEDDMYSRRAVIHIKDLYNSQANHKDVPCTESIQFLIRQNKLHMTVTMRSNDVSFGLPYDIFFFTTLQMFMLKGLRERYPNLRLGEYNHYVKSLHVYEKDYGNMKRWISKFEKGIPSVNYTELEAFMYKLNFQNIRLAYQIVNQALGEGNPENLWTITGDEVSDTLIISMYTRFFPLSKELQRLHLPNAFQEVLNG